MDFKYTLPEHFRQRVVKLIDFANGGTQVTVRLKNGTVYPGVLISNSKWIIAIRGHKELPFGLDEIEDIYQTEVDKNPERGGWHFWDEWAKSTIGKRWPNKMGQAGG